ncbi:MAG TPA: hypothetical protein VFJ21_14930 [Mycobacteriales bacterium]|nr:hypothetical protein [Mycobacteriales bacterium]
MPRLAELPTPLRTVVVLLAAEGVGVLVGGFYVAIAPLWRHVDTSLALTEVEAALTAATGAGLLWVARGLAGLRRWARSPAVLTQLLAVPVGVSLLQVGLTAYGAVVVAVPAIVLLLLLGSPQARAPWE